MATYGPRSTTELVKLTGWDDSAIAAFDKENGTDYMTIARMMNAALGTLNDELLTHPLWSQIVSYQDRPEVEYRVGSSNGFEEHTEYGRPDAKRAATEGHMIPLKPYDRRLAWTWDYLKRARLDQIEADIADVVKDARDLWRTRILTRLLQRGDDSGALKGLGASGYSPGFATTAASTNVDFVPPSYGGVTFTSTHEHYVTIAGGLFTAAVFQDARMELREHGHEPPYTFLVGLSDMDTIVGLTGFVPAPSLTVNYGQSVSLANLQQMAVAPGVYPLGAIHDNFVYCVSGLPQYYGIALKSYGANSQRNPLRIRLEKGVTQPRVIAMTDPETGNGMYPVQNIMLYTEFGVGVADRTGATPRYVNHANTWTDGTPT